MPQLDIAFDIFSQLALDKHLPFLVYLNFWSFKIAKIMFGQMHKRE